MQEKDVRNKTIDNSVETPCHCNGANEREKAGGRVIMSSKIWSPFIFMFLMLITLIWLDEILDLPHHLLGTIQTPINWGQALIESIVIASVGFIAGMILLHNVKRAKCIENSLLESEAHYRGIFEATTDAFLIFDEEGRIREANPAACGTYGYSHDRLVGLTGREIVHPGSYHIFVKAMEEVKAGRSFTAESLDMRQDGSTFNIEARLAPFCFKGKPHLLAIIRDITERKKMEQELREEREKLFSVLDMLPAFVYILAHDYSIPFANKKFREMFGNPEGHPCFELLHGRDKPCWGCPTSEVFNKKAPQTWEWMDREGRNYLIYDNLFPGSDGAKMVLKVGIDITDRKHMEQELLTTNKLETVGLLAGDVARELKHIIRKAIKDISLTGSEMLSGDRNSTLLSTLEDSLRKAETLAHKMIEIGNTCNPDKKISALPALIKKSTNLTLMDSTIESRFYFAEDLWPIEVDEWQIGQVITHLIANAKQSMQSNGSIEVHIENIDLTEYEAIPRNKGQYIRITIKDQGEGIAGEDLTKIFDPLYTTKGKKIGLGLAICDSIIKNHDGFIDVKSVPGVGTTFYIYLPTLEKAAHISA